MKNVYKSTNEEMIKAVNNLMNKIKRDLEKNEIQEQESLKAYNGNIPGIIHEDIKDYYYLVS